MIWEIKRRLYGWGHTMAFFAPLLGMVINVITEMQDNWEHY